MPNYKVIVTELKRPLIQNGIILGSLVTLLTAGYLYSESIETQRQMSQQNLEQTERDYRNAVSSTEILRSESARFAALRDGGFFGPEPRLRWIEDVRETAIESKVVSIRYSLEPRHAPPPKAPTGSYVLYASTMKLDMELRHEDDLFDFFNALQARNSGLFKVTECNLGLYDTKGILNLHGANVKASCSLEWYTLDKPESGGTGQAS